MKIIALEKEIEGVEASQFAPHLKNESLKVLELYNQSFIREIYFRDDRSEAVLILEAESIDSARLLLAELPLVKEKLIEFDLIPLKPYPGWGRLLEE